MFEPVIVMIVNYDANWNFINLLLLNVIAMALL